MYIYLETWANAELEWVQLWREVLLSIPHVGSVQYKPSRAQHPAHV